MAGYARMFARGAVKAARAQRQVKANAAAKASGAPPPGISPESFMGPMAAGAAAQAASQVASGYAAAYSSGQPFHWQQAIGGASTIAAAAAGMAIGGPMGGVAAAAISIGGQAAQNWWQGGINQGVQQQLAAFMAGTPIGSLNSAANALGGVSGPYRMGGTSSFGTMGGFSAMGQMGSFVGGGLDLGQIRTMAGNLIRQFGDPSKAAFQAAAGSLSSVGIDPYLSSQFGAGPLGGGAGASIGLGGISQAYDQLGPMGAYLAVNASGSDSDKNLLRRVVRADRLSQVRTQAYGNMADIGRITTMAMETTGNRGEIMRAFGMESSADDASAAQFGDAERLAIHEGGPFGSVKATQAHRGLAMAQLAAATARFGRSTVGPSGSWVSTTLQAQTDEQMALSDPLTGFVSPATRFGLIRQYGSRLGQITQQINDASPAQREGVEAALAPERSLRQLQRQQEQNALRYGLVGQYLDVAAGMPSGFQAQGLSAMSFAALQRHDRGIAPAFGGTGSSVGGGTVESPTMIRLLERIARALEAGRPGSSGGGMSSAYALVQGRANGKVGN